MRSSVSAIALIGRGSATSRRWLLRWNPKWDAYALVGGGIEETDKSPRAALERELREELDAASSAATTVGDPLRKMEYEGFSLRANENTRYTIHPFRAEWKLETEPGSSSTEKPLLWATREDIETRASELKISPTVRWILHHAGWEVPVQRGTASQLGRVAWQGEALKRLTDEDAALLMADLEIAFPAPARAVVHDVLTGFRKTGPSRMILAVDVLDDEKHRSGIVKVGARSEIAADARGYHELLGRGPARSVVLMPVEICDIVSPDKRSTHPTDRIAVIYEDATVGAPGEMPAKLVEDAAKESVRSGSPEIASVVRSLRQVWVEMRGRLQLPTARADSATASVFFDARLHRAHPLWEKGTDGFEQRLAFNWLVALWLHRSPAPLWADPVEYLEHAAKSPAPAFWCGTIHGDLHARNVMVSVDRNEAMFPAVFDYGEATDKGVLAWDFVKMEHELKIRLYDEVLHSPEARSAAHALFALVEGIPPQSIRPFCPDEDRGMHDRRFELALLVLRVECFLAGVMDEFVRSPKGATRAVLDAHASTMKKAPALARLVELVLSVREEFALLATGLRNGRAQPTMDWCSEYFHVLAAYAVQAAKYGYERVESDCSLASGGVAAAWLVSRQPLTTLDKEFCSQRAWVAIRDGRRKGPASILAQASAMQERFSACGPVPRELAMLHLDAGNVDAADELLGDAGNGRMAEVVRDYEWFARRARAAKERLPLLPFNRKAYRRKAVEVCQWYMRGWELSGHHFPGSNAAKWAAVLGKPEAPDIAEKAYASAENYHAESRDHDDEAYWTLITMAEMMILAGDSPEDVVATYKEGLRAAGPGRDKIAASRSLADLQELSRHPGFPDATAVIGFLTSWLAKS